MVKMRCGVNGPQTVVSRALAGKAERPLYVIEKNPKLRNRQGQYMVTIEDGRVLKRGHDALQFTVSRRFSKALYMQGSYTYSRTKGNYPGLISYDNGQIDPNISSQYDLIELLGNRQGPLNQDKPHYIKLDGYYKFDLKKAGEITLGTRLRALSGIPRQAQAAHWLYGPGESFLLPRGQIGRTQFETGIDLHLGYAKKLKGNMELEVFTDLFNLVSLVDPDQFRFEGEFQNVLDANRPLVRLANQLKRPETTVGMVHEALDEAELHWLFRNSESLKLFKDNLGVRNHDQRLDPEERVAMSPDALTGMEANLRFNGPENMFTRIFGRLTAWQNWIFQRPNAVGEKGALKVYGKGDKAAFDWSRV